MKQLPLATKTCVLGHVGYSCQNEKVNAREHIPLLVVEHLDTRSRFNQFYYFLKLPSKITRCRIPSFSYNPIDYAALWAVVYTFSMDKRPSLAFNGKARNLSCLRNVITCAYLCGVSCKSCGFDSKTSLANGNCFVRLRKNSLPNSVVHIFFNYHASK